MYLVPRSRVGKWALGLLLVVALYPLYWSLFLLVPDSWRAVSLGLGAFIPLVALASLILAGVAILHRTDRSVLLIVLAAVTLVMMLSFTIGEAVVPH